MLKTTLLTKVLTLFKKLMGSNLMQDCKTWKTKIIIIINQFFLFYVRNNVPQIGTNVLHAPKDELVAQKHKFKQSVE
jgi:hypothetical protein